MKSFEFTLLTEATHPKDGEEVENALFHAGCDDALLLRRDGVWCLDFEREAESLLPAVLDAIDAVEGAGVGLVVVRVAPDEMVTATEIAMRTKRTRESVRLWAAGRRGSGGFPVPVRGVRAKTRLWRWSEVVAWMAIKDGRATWAEEVERARTTAAVNAALDLRRLGAAAGATVLQRLVARAS